MRKPLSLGLALLLGLMMVLSAPRVHAAGSIALNPSSQPVGYSSPVTVSVAGTGTAFAAGDTTVTVLNAQGANTGAASAVSIISATSLAFTLATGLPAGTYSVRVLTSSDTWTAPLQIIVPTISAVAPASTYVGYAQPVAVTLTGQGTRWAAGQTTVSVVGGGAAITSLVVSSATSLTFSLGTGLSAGSKTLRVTTGSEVVDATFAVRSPTMTPAPASATEGYGSPVAVTVTGVQTAFVAGTTTVSLLDAAQAAVSGAISSLNVASATQLSLNIGTGLSPGTYALQTNTGGEVVTAAFTVAAAPVPSIAISPAAANVGYSPFTVTVTGQNTSFQTGQTAVSIRQVDGTLVQNAAGVAVSSATALTFTFPAGISAGNYKVRVQTGSQTADAAAVVRTPSMSVSPAALASPLAAPTTITVAGINTDFAQGASTVQVVNNATDAQLAGLGTPVVTSATALSFTVPATIADAAYTVRVITGGQTVTASLTVSANVLAITTAAPAAVANQRAGPITVQIRNVSGQPVNAPADVTVSLSSSSGGGTFYAAATGGSAITTVVIPTGSSSASFYYRDTAPGTAVIRTAAGAYGSPQQVFTVTQATIAAISVTAAPASAAGSRSGAIAIALQDADGSPVLLSSSTSITLESSAASGRFYATVSGGSAITSITASVGSSGLSVYYTDTAAGSPQLTARVGGVAGTATATITAGSASVLRFDAASAGTATAGQRSAALVLRLDDLYGNAAPAGAGGVAVSLNTSSGTGQVFTQASGGSPVTTVTIAAGATSTSLYLQDVTAGSLTLNAAAGAMNATWAVIVSPAAAASLLFATSPRTVTTSGRSDGISVQLRDAHGNAAVAAASVTLSLITTAASGSFFSQPTGGSAVTTATIALGEGTSTFHYADTLAGSPTVTVSAPGLGSAQQTVTVVPAGAAQLQFSNPAHTSAAGRRTAALTLALLDQQGNATAAGAALAVTLQSTSATGRFYTAVSGGSPVTSVTIPLGVTSAFFYYEDTVAGAPTLTAAASGVTAAQQAVTVTPDEPARLLLTNVARTATSGQRTAALTVQAQDAFGNNAAPAAALYLSLTSTSGTGQFFAAAAGGAAVSGVTMATFGSTVDFYYQDTTSGTHTVTVAATGLTSATQNVVITSAGGNGGVGGGTPPTPPVQPPAVVTPPATEVTPPVVKPPDTPTTPPSGAQPAETRQESPTGTTVVTVQEDGTAAMVEIVEADRVVLGPLPGPLVIDLAAAEVQTGTADLPASAPVIRKAVEVPAGVIEQLLAGQRGLSIQAGSVRLELPPEALQGNWQPATPGDPLRLRIDILTLDAGSESAAGADLAAWARDALGRAAGQGLRATGPVVSITVAVVDGAGAVPVARFAQKVTIGLPLVGGDIRGLGVYRLDRSTGRWEFRGGRLDAAAGWITVRVDGFSEYTVLAYQPIFMDTLDHWARADVERMASRHVAQGISGAQFLPDGIVTRAQFAAYAVRALLLPEPAPPGPAFADVAPTDWFSREVALAAGHGLILGHDGRFRPNDSITRQEMAVILSRALVMAGVDAGETDLASGDLLAALDRFADGDRVAEWARTAVAAAARTGLLQGRPDGSVAPEDLATRAEAVTMLRRLLQLLGEVE